MTAGCTLGGKPVGLVLFQVWSSLPSLQPCCRSSEQAQGGAQEGCEPAVLACFPSTSRGPLNEAALIPPRRPRSLSGHLST